MHFVVLGLLLHAPMSSYDLHRAFRESVAMFYAASYGSLQRSLTLLAENGWITSVDAPTGKRARKEHRANAAGIAAWRAWMHSPVPTSDAETVILSRVFFLGELPADERPDVIAVVRERIVTDLHALRATADELGAISFPPEAADVARFRLATLDYGVRAHTMALDWLDALD